MGVPGFFSWLIRKNKNEKIIQDINKKINIDYLCLDANCLFHPRCFKVLKYYNENKITIKREELEKRMMKNIIEYIDKIYDEINPRILYICVDGVAPLAKIIQQRKRRFKSVKNNEELDTIKGKYKNRDMNEWSNIVITPGTEFMSKLDREIRKYIKENEGIKKIIYSSYRIKGEGEHKIFNKIKKKKGENIMIYGLDADLIFLSLTCSDKNNIYLLREEDYLKQKKMGDEEKFCMIEIEKIKNIIDSKFIKKDKDINTKVFILLMFFIGNDFLPHIPSINIRNGGIDFIIDTYNKIQEKEDETLIENNKINYNILKKVIKLMSDKEDYYFKNVYKKDSKTNNLNNNDRITKNNNRTYEIEKKEHEDNKEYRDIDTIRLGEDGQINYKYRYYLKNFKVRYYQEELKRDLSKEYIRGIEWVLNYYLNNEINNEWCYQYTHSPFISDIYDYIKNINTQRIKKYDFTHLEKLNTQNLFFSIDSFKTNQKKKEKKNASVHEHMRVNKTKNIEIEPFLQLLLVIPKKYNKVIPEEYRKYINDNSTIIDMFPEKINENRENIDKLWKCVPNIPNIDIERVKNAVSKSKIKNKKKRNEINTIEVKNF